MSCRTRWLIVLVIAAVCASSAANFPNHPILTLPYDACGGTCYDFAISPDGKRVAAVGYAEMESDRTGHRSVVLLDTATGHELKRAVLEPDAAAIQFRALFTATIRYTADGSRVVVEGGDHLDVLNASDLELMQSIPYPLLKGSPAELGSRRWSISADGKHIATLTGQMKYLQVTGEVRTYELDTGKRLAEFSVPVYASDIALAPGGIQVVVGLGSPVSTVAALPSPPDLLVFDTGTGSVQKRFASHLGSKNGNITVYWPDKEKIASFSIPSSANRGLSFFDAIDANSGAVKQERTYPARGYAADVWPSIQNGGLAVLYGNVSWLRYNFTEGGASEMQLLFYRRNENKPCVVKPLPNGKTHQTGFLRFSDDLSTFGTFLENEIKIFANTACR